MLLAMYFQEEMELIACEDWKLSLVSINLWTVCSAGGSALASGPAWSLSVSGYASLTVFRHGCWSVNRLVCRANAAGVIKQWNCYSLPLRYIYIYINKWRPTLTPFSYSSIQQCFIKFCFTWKLTNDWSWRPIWLRLGGEWVPDFLFLSLCFSTGPLQCLCDVPQRLMF